MLGPSHADDAAKRSALLGTMRVEYEAIRDSVAAAPDAASAWHLVAGHWLRLHLMRREVLSSLADDGGAAVLGTMQIFDAPPLRDVPLRALGLRQVAEDEGVPVWIGTPAMLGAAAEAMGYAGHAAAFAPDREHADLMRDGRRVATLLADPEFVVDAVDRAPAIKGPSHGPAAFGWLALGAAIALLRWDYQIAGGAVLAAAPVPWLVAVTGRAVRRRRPPEHRLAVRPAASATPYRGEQRAAMPDLASVGAALARAGLSVRRRGDRLRVAPGVVIAPVAGGFDVTSADPVVAMRCVHAMVAATGPVQVQLGRTISQVASPDAYPAWEVQRRADDAARAALAAALADGYGAAVATIYAAG